VHFKIGKRLRDAAAGSKRKRAGKGRKWLSFAQLDARNDRIRHRALVKRSPLGQRAC
jgi:hypothetical protein